MITKQPTAPMYQNHPAVLDRIKSTLIDSVIIIACMVLFSDVLDNFADVPNWVRAALALSLLMYEPVCTTFGATLGQHKMQIRVRKIGDETKPINLFQAIIRYFFKILLGWLSFISIFMSNKSRAIHDIVSGSVMVNAKTEA